MEAEIIAALCKPRFELSPKHTLESIAIIIKQYEYGVTPMDMKTFIEWRESAKWYDPTAPTQQHENTFEQVFVFDNAILPYHSNMKYGMWLYPVLKEREMDPKGNDHTNCRYLGILHTYIVINNCIRMIF